MKRILLVMVLLLSLGVIASVSAQDEFVFGMILVGPQNDGGWSQAHFEGGLYVQEKVAGAKMLVFEKLNPADSPEATVESVVTDMVDQGAKLIITASDEFEEDTAAVAALFPDVTFINASGDDAYIGGGAPNLGNVMGQMEWGKLIAGCAAGLTTETGSIGYLGPLINAETRRLAMSAYLGARHCYEMRGMDPSALKFTVTWIGFWFNIPGVTLDPTEEVNHFFDGGADVVMSGIDTTEAIVVTAQRAAEGQAVWAVPYDSAAACAVGESVCLGVPYFNWGPAYTEIISAAVAGTYAISWDLTGPDWADLNNVDTSGVGFIKGAALSEENSAHLDAFIAEATAFAAANPDAIYLWQGPLNYQDGSEYAADGAILPYIAKQGEAPSVWYAEQLFEGMTGVSST